MGTNGEGSTLYKADVGYAFFFRKSRTFKKVDPDTKRIKEEITVEASLKGNEETYSNAYEKLIQARKDIETELSLDSEQ